MELELEQQNQTDSENKYPQKTRPKLTKGILLTLILALVAGEIAKIPFLSIMGTMIISILLGIITKAIWRVPLDYAPGISFSSKYLLRLGIILMGIRLHFGQIIDTGLSIIVIDIIVIIFTLTIILLLGKIAAVDRFLTTLIAVGTAVCGAAAIAAVAPIIKARKEHIALSVAIIAILGTVGTIIYTFIYPILDLNQTQYGVLVGSTLHELAHVIAAAAPSGAVGSETAIVVKLGRVALLIPVALIIGLLFNRHPAEQKTERLKGLPIPWFIFGFLGFSLINTFVDLPGPLVSLIVKSSVIFMSMAMAGMGLGINLVEFKKAGAKPVIIGIIGFAALTLLGPFLLYLV